MSCKKRKKKYFPKDKSIPMIVNRTIHENAETLEEHSIIIAFQFGVATKEHYDWLTRMGNMINVACQTKPSEFALQLLANFDDLSKKIFARYEKTNKLGVNGEELKLMRKLVGEYDQYWKRQGTALYNKCVGELNAFYLELAEKRKNYLTA